MKNFILLLFIFNFFIVKSQTFTKSVISSNQTNGAFGLVEFPINSDSYLDLISASKVSNTVAYYINNGDNTFSQHIIDNNLQGATFAFANDMDVDGDLDFVAVGTSELVWYENDGTNNYNKHSIASINGASFVIVYDIDSDGDGDIGVAISGENYITAFLYNAGGSFTRINAISVNNPKMFYGGDFDGNGENDILVPSFDDNKISWYHFNGYYFVQGGVVANNFDGVWWAEGADIDNDGDLDVVATSYNGNKISWFENNGTGTNFTEHVIESDLNHAMYLRVVDMDGDSDMDIVASGFGNGSSGSEVAMYINDGNQNFVKTTLDNVEQGSACVSVQDFDGNGSKDIAFASNGSNRYLLLSGEPGLIGENTKQYFRLFPNPAHNIVDVSSFLNIEKIEIFDLTGRKILKQAKTRINISRFTKGNYLVKVYFQNGNVSAKKLIVQ